MGNGMNKVLPGLYLGSFRDGKDPEQLQTNEITHIVSIHDAAKEVVEDKKYLCIRVPDNPDENLTRYFPRCNDFIHGARMGGGNVLVHCLAGVSRSATIAAAYIMSVTNLNCKDALKVVRGARTIANPNYGFHSQLKEFESYSLTSERKRLKIRFKTYDNQKLDEEECAKMITVYQSNSTPSSTNSSPSSSFKKGSTSATSSPVTSPLHRPNRTYYKTSISACSSPVSSPLQRPNYGFYKPSTSACSSPVSSPLHKPNYGFYKPSTSTTSLPGSSPVHKPTPKADTKTSASCNSSPSSSPFHRLRFKYRSASSSPKRR